jgi:hypothetical protein
MTDRVDQDLSKSKLKQLTKHREVTLLNKVVQRVPVAEDLLVVLDSKIGRTVEHLLGELAALVVTATAGKGQKPFDPELKDLDPNKVNSDPAGIPSFKPVWAENRLTQLDRRLWEEGESIAAWLHKPSDPDLKEGCHSCGRNKGLEDLYCRFCGTPTLRAYRRCWFSKCGNYGRRRMDCPASLTHPEPADSPRKPTLDRVPPGILKENE